MGKAFNCQHTKLLTTDTFPIYCDKLLAATATAPTTATSAAATTTAAAGLIITGGSFVALLPCLLAAVKLLGLLLPRFLLLLRSLLLGLGRLVPLRLALALFKLLLLGLGRFVFRLPALVGALLPSLVCLTVDIAVLVSINVVGPSGGGPGSCLAFMGSGRLGFGACLVLF